MGAIRGAHCKEGLGCSVVDGFRVKKEREEQTYEQEGVQDHDWENCRHS